MVPYVFRFGDGQDVVADGDSTAGNSDTVSFDSSISVSSIAFFKTSTGDLQFGYVNDTTDQVTVQNASSAANTIETFSVSNGLYLTNTDINNVINQMSTYASSHGVTMNSLASVENNAGLMAIVNAAWHG